MSYFGRYRYKCEPGGTVIRALGGARHAAKILGVSTELCSQWNRPPSRGGTGGAIPQRFWDAIIKAAVSKKITVEFLETGKTRAKSGGRASKTKGTMFERQVTNELKAAGLNASRVPLSGALAGYPGDVIIEDTPTGKWILQCKISRGAGGRGGIAAMLKQVVVGRVDAGEAKFVAMRRAQFIDLVRGDAPQPINMPTLKVRGLTVLSHIEGHDALVFRRSGATEWHALVRTEKLKEK